MITLCAIKIMVRYWQGWVRVSLLPYVSQLVEIIVYIIIFIAMICIMICHMFTIICVKKKVLMVKKVSMPGLYLAHTKKMELIQSTP